MKGDKTMKKYRLWSGTEDNQYENCRIPGMLVTTNGTLIIYNEARTTGSDWALMDIFCRRSGDHGNTFGPPIYLAVGNEKHPTVNNPVMMQDKNGRIHFLYCEDYGINGGRILRRYSDDDGLTWSEPFDITQSTMPDCRNAFALGPGHGICTGSGTLIVPCWFVPKSVNAPVNQHSPSAVSTLYSTDCGEHWRLGEILSSTEDIISPNESVAVERSDGNIYLSIRHNRQGLRARAVSRDGYSGWTDYELDPALIDPVCFGSVAAYKTDSVPYTILLVNCENPKVRTHVTVKGSVDNGNTWGLRCVIDEDQGGYPEIAVDNKNGLIYVLYEGTGAVELYLAILEYCDVLPSPAEDHD